MADWGPVFVAVVLFVLLNSGLLFQIRGRARSSSSATSTPAELPYWSIPSALICVFLLAIGVHVHVG